MENKDIVAIVALILTYLSFLSGARVIYLISLSKTSEKLSVIPFLAGLLCMSLWLNYSLLVNEWSMICVNVSGIVLQTIYISFFIHYSNTKSRLIKQTIGMVLFIAVLISAMEFVPNPESLAGLAAATSSFIACASPLATVKEVYESKNVSSLPLPLIVSSFVVSLSWCLLGYLIDDHFIFLSNAVTSFISLLQLSLFAIYPWQDPYELLPNKNFLDMINLMRAGEDDIEISEADLESIRDGPSFTIVLTALMGQIYAKRIRPYRQPDSPTEL